MAGINIRGIDGNRILMMVDGVRIPESYAGGGSNGAISGRDMVESDTRSSRSILSRTLFRALRQRCARRRGEHGHALTE